jgi:ATP-binding cassette, subfamily B, bacterial MsbA
MLMEPNHYSAKALLGRLWRDYIYPHRAKMLLAGFFMVLVALATAANAYLMQPILDDIFLEKDRTMLTLIPLAVIIVFLINAGATYGQNVILQVMGQRIIATMQAQLYRHLIHADVGLFADQSSGRLISRFTNDIYLLRNSVSTIFTGAIREALTLIALIGVMFYQSPILALIALTIFPVSILPVIRLGKRMRKISSQTQMGLSHFAGQLDETFAGVRLVKAYGQEEREIARASGQIEHLYSLYAKAARVQAVSSPMMELLTGFAIAAIVWYGGAQVMDGHTTPGSFFSFVTAMIMAYKPAKTLAGFNTQLNEGLASASRLFAVLDTKPQVAEAPDARPLAVSAGTIRMENLTFRYEGGHRGGVEDITLDIPAGKTVALVGPSGGGKSTLMNLLLRFYDPQQGRILIDGQDIRGVTLHSLRDAISIVSQETVLFDDSIAANIAYGRAEATQEQIQQAARDAAAHDFITALPEGYQTRVGPSGVKLSGGQRQRIAIARALLKDSPILLLDEATSALDTQSERLVQTALERLMQGRTTLVIAHRLSTIRHADTIVVLDHGRITETGTHDTLLTEKSKYWELYATQTG